jgi:TRAP-type uncharacterized transport system substrate-binding protein
MKQSAKLALSAAALGAALLAAAPVSAQQVTLMTGPQGGVWVPLGGALKGMWEKAIPGLQITAQPGAGVANVIGVEQGKAQIGFSNSSSAVDGAMGVPPFKQKSTNFNWLVAASILALFSFNLLAISKKTKASKEQYIIEQYSTIDANFTSYE